MRLTRQDDPVARSASEVIGGPLGRYAPRGTLSWPVVAALLMAVAGIGQGLAVVLRAPCLRDAWASPDQFFHMCYSDLPPVYQTAHLDGGLLGFFTGGPGTPAPSQPPVTALVLTVLGALTPEGAGRAPGDMVAYQLKTNFALWSVLATILACALVWWVASLGRTRPLRAAHVAFAPVLVLASTISADLVGVALATAGMYTWARRRPVAAGVLLGLAIGARSYPVLIVIAIVLLALRTGQLREALTTAVAAAATFATVLALLMMGNPAVAQGAYREWWSAAAGYGSPWYLPALTGSPMQQGMVTALQLVGWLCAVVAGALLALATARRPTLAEVCLPMVAIVLVTGKAFPVQSSLWLIPLVALTALPWRDHLWWAGAETIYFGAVWLHVAGHSVPDRGLPAGWYAFFLMMRLVGVGYLAWRVVETARARPSMPAEPEIDECAGVLAGLPDRFVVDVR